MWALHKLRSEKRKRSEIVVGPTKESGHSVAPDELSVRQDDASINAVDVEEPRRKVPRLESPWDFTQDEVQTFPALRKRNFWCIQRHQARGDWPVLLLAGGELTVCSVALRSADAAGWNDDVLGYSKGTVG